MILSWPSASVSLAILDRGYRQRLAQILAQSLVMLTFLDRARVAKLADAPDLGSGSARIRGSSPLPGTFIGSVRIDRGATICSRFALRSARRPEGDGYSKTE